MNKLSEEQMLQNLNKFYEIIKTYISADRSDKLLDMYKDLEDTLVTAPASTKKEYYNAFFGGYLDHVLKVVDCALILDKVWDKFNQIKNYTTEELVFSAINHDLGKLGYKDIPQYITNKSDWHVKQGAYFAYNPELTHMRMADRSLFMLQKYSIEVSENEYLAIKLHNGCFEEANMVYYRGSGEFQIRTNLVYIIHQADFTASKIQSQNN